MRGEQTERWVGGKPHPWQRGRALRRGYLGPPLVTPASSVAGLRAKASRADGLHASPESLVLLPNGPSAPAASTPATGHGPGAGGSGELEGGSGTRPLPSQRVDPGYPSSLRPPRRTKIRACPCSPGCASQPSRC